MENEFSESTISGAIFPLLSLDPRFLISKSEPSVGGVEDKSVIDWLRLIL